ISTLIMNPILPFSLTQFTQIKINTLALLFGLICLTIHTATSQNEPLKVGVIGLTHTHVHWILGRPQDDKVVIVGIVETNMDLGRRYTQRHGLPMELIYATLDELMKHNIPEAVLAVGTIYDHLKLVEKLAPQGIHGMAEKPLAVGLDQAKIMWKMAKKH